MKKEFNNIMPNQDLAVLISKSFSTYAVYKIIIIINASPAMKEKELFVAKKIKAKRKHPNSQKKKFFRRKGTPKLMKSVNLAIQFLFFV